MADTRRLIVKAGFLRMGIDVALIREVAALPELSPLPRGPSAALGVTLLRGELTPVVDLARLIDPAASGANLTRIVSLTSPKAALAVERIEALESTQDDAPCLLDADGERRPFDLGAQLARCFDDAWRQARALAT